MLNNIFKRGKWWRWSTIILMIVLLILQARSVLPGLIYRHQTSAIKAYSVWVGQSTQDNARIIAGDEGPFITHYAKRQAVTRPSCVQSCPQVVLEEFREQIDRWIKEGLPIYMTNTALLADNPNGEFKTFIESHYRLEYIGQHLMEDWHHDIFRLRVGYEKLFLLVKRELKRE